MCKKCKELKKTWWQKQKNVYDTLSPTKPRHSFFAMEAERNSAWRALYNQKKKHIPVNMKLM